MARRTRAATGGGKAGRGLTKAGKAGRGLTKAGKAGRDLLAAGEKAAALPAAVAVTLGKRLPVLARATAGPSREDGAEIERMVAEKAKAALEVASALAKGTNAAVAQTAKALRKAKPPAGARSANPLIAANAWLSWWPNALAQACQPWWTAAATLDRALAPVHRRVTANAKRLSKRKG